MSPLFICLYCRASKPASDFNREHVLPDAFGRFHGRNFVLKRVVCKECNNLFGDTIDAKLAHDSMEGIDRFMFGLAAPPRFRPVGSSIEVTMRSGRLRGARLEFAGDSERGELGARPRRQVGFATNAEGPFEWYDLADAPEASALEGRGLTYVLFGGVTEHEALDFLKTRNLAWTDRLVDHQPEANVEVNLRGRFDDEIQRAVAKIAFNYLAFHYLPIADLAQFDIIRRFIRYGERGLRPLVEVVEKPMLGNTPPGVRLLGHMVAVRWDATHHTVVGQVSLYDWVQYRITLSNAFFGCPPFCVDSGHCFHVGEKQILELSRDPRRAVAVPLITRDEYERGKSAACTPRKADR